MTASPDLPSTVPATPEAWLTHGQVLEAGGHADRAVDAYDRAIAQYRLQLAAFTPASRRALGVALMNRGNALQKLAEPEWIAAAVHAYDEAIRWFETLPIDTDPIFRNHLGAAWLNRGHALLGTENNSRALASFERAIAHLEKLPLIESPFFRLNLAGAWTNCAHLQLTTLPSLARTSAQRALSLLNDVEQQSPAFAEMSLRARRALVTALGALLVIAESAREPVHALATEASDAIDDGLALAHAWEARGLTSLRPLALRLFRLGTQLYRMHQPHFLAEFLIENIGPVAPFAGLAEFRHTGEESLRTALAELQRPRHLIVDSPEAGQLLAAAQSLREVQVRLFTPRSCSELPKHTSPA